MLNKFIKNTNSNYYLYENIVKDISELVSKGVLKAGEKLPSIRKLSEHLSVSVSTVVHTYIELERLGLVEASPKSGFYISDNPVDKTTLNLLNVETMISRYGCEEVVTCEKEISKRENVYSFGAGIPSREFLPAAGLNKILREVSRSSNFVGLNYEFPPGNTELISQIEKRYMGWKNFSKDEIIITSGATEAINLSLKAITQPGDIILVDSPFYFLIGQIIRNLGLRILEVPAHIKYGIDINKFKNSIKQNPIAACILYPSVSNPTGSIIPVKNKASIYEILFEKRIPVIECDIYGELYYGDKRPKPIKTYDEEGLVIYISSFSKTLAPGYRVGWMSSGKFYEKIKGGKFLNTLATQTLPQLVIERFLRNGEYDRYLRSVRKKYEANLDYIIERVKEYFPGGTRIEKPEGGFYLWVELPEKINSLKLQKLALKENITFAPGPLFSSCSSKYLNFIRLSCANPISQATEPAIKKLGDLCNF